MANRFCIANTYTTGVALHFFTWKLLEYKMNNKSRSAAMLLLILMAGIVSACNTVAGVGKDTQKAGEVIEDASGKD